MKFIAFSYFLDVVKQLSNYKIIEFFHRLAQMNSSNCTYIFIDSLCLNSILIRSFFQIVYSFQ